VVRNFNLISLNSGFLKVLHNFVKFHQLLTKLFNFNQLASLVRRGLDASIAW